MRTISHKRIKKGMSFHDCVNAITEGNTTLALQLPEVCQKASTMYGTLAVLDTMEVYGNDLALLFSDICENDKTKLLTIIWAFEVQANPGNHNVIIPYFAQLKTIKELITDVKSGKEVTYPFDEAKSYIEENSLIRFKE